MPELEETDALYLERFIEREEKALEGRKAISELLLRIAFQSLSCGLAILLFQFALSVWVTSLLCYLISLAPLIKGLSFLPTEGGIKVIIMRDGIRLVVSFIIAVGFTHVKLNEVYSQIQKTDEGINNFLVDLHSYERPTEWQYHFPSQGVILLAAIASTVVLGYLADLNKRGK